MSMIDKIPLQEVKIFLSLQDVAPGELVFLGGDVQALGLNCVYAPSVGQLQPGFVPLEGPNQFAFLDARTLGSAPALDLSKIAYLAVEAISLQNKHLILSPGDLCIFQGREDLSLAIALPADLQAIAGYLMLQGQHAGYVVNGYLAQVRLGKATVVTSSFPTP